MKSSKSSRVVAVDLLENRSLLSAAVGGWTVMSAVPKARGLTTDLRLANYTPLTLAADTIANSLSRAPKEDVAKYGIGRGAGSRLLSLPTPDGGFARFRVVESSILTGNDQAKYGKSIRTFAGVGVDDPAATVRLDFTPLGFHAQVLTKAGEGAYYVEPLYRNNQSVYASYYATDNRGPAVAPTEIDVEKPGSTADTDVTAPTSVNRSTGTVLRTYRTAVAATAEYTAFFGGTVAAGQAAIVTAVNRVTGIYENELGIRLTLVSNNSSLVFTNTSTDGYTNNNGGTMLSQNQTKVDSIIGSANYDIGHVFSTGGGGVAYLGVVGEPGYKAGGVTGSGSPTGDAFWVDYVAHEMGHQFGGDHTFDTSQDSNRNDSTAYEPGSGSTIMAYAGIEGNEDLQANSDPYFAFASIDQILTYVDVTRPTVGTRTNTGNSVPTLPSAMSNYTIPANTPFTLTAPTAVDANGDTVTYSWEQADLGTNNTGRLLDAADDGSSPLFRVYNPTTSPSRTFPRLASVLAGQTTTQARYSGRFAERLPTTSRAMKFVLTLRDNRAGGGGTNALSSSPVTVTSVAAASNFAVSNFNTASTVAGGSVQTINWNVAGTTANGINTANVQILMSTDGGQTFPIALANSTANDGTEAVQMPYNTASSQVRFKVAAVGNIYFDINNANLTLTNVAPPASAVPGAPDLTGENSGLNVIRTDNGVSFTDNLTNRNNSTASQYLQFQVDGTVSGATVTLYANGTAIGSAVATGTTTFVSTNGTTTLTDGVHSFTVRQTEPGKTLSAASAALAVTIDTVAPQFVSPAMLSYVNTKPQVNVYFNDAVYGSSPANFSVVKLGTPNTGVSYTYNAAGTVTSLMFPTAPNGILPDGNYTVTANAPAKLTDAAGNSVSNTLSFDFFVLSGDADHNRVVDFNDFLALQNHFNETALNFSYGDFDYNGVIDFNDFLILQNQFGKVV